MKKTTLVATALVSVLSASSAFAWWGDQGQSNGQGSHKGYNNCSSGQAMHDQGKQGRKGGMHGGKGMRGQQMLENMNRTLTAAEVKTLQEARLIYMNNPNIKVGEVKATDSGYNVTIVTKDNSLVKELKVAKNGMMQDRYDMIQKRIDMKQQRMNDRAPQPAAPSR